MPDRPLGEARELRPPVPIRGGVEIGKHTVGMSPIAPGCRPNLSQCVYQDALKLCIG
jgi:hypothetical protein